MIGYTYRPGTWQVVVEDGGVVAVPGDVTPERIAQLSRMLQAGTPALTEVIDVLAAGSIATLGSFAVALTPGGAVRLAVRGPVTVRIDSEAGAETVSGADVSTWSERYVVEPSGFDIALGDQPGGIALAIRSGVVLAGAVRTGDDIASVGSVGSDAGSATEEPETPATAIEAGPIPVVAGAALPAEASATAPTDVDEASDAAESADDPEPTETIAAVEPSPETGEIDAVDAIASLFAEPDAHLQTLIPSEVTLAADSDLLGLPDVEPSVLSTPPSSGESTPSEGALTSAPLPPAPTAAPLFPPVPPMPGTVPPPPPAALGDHDGATISLAEVRRMRAEAGTAPAAPDAPTEIIPAVGSPASGHGRVRLSTGQVIELDRTVIIGRRPRSTRASGDTMPHLVAVDSPQQDISRSHLEIRPEGDSVVVIDLRTTNGSTLIRPGADPVRLHPGEHTLVLDGDVVDLGDGVTAAFEGLV